jgi:hypothetical protein
MVAARADRRNRRAWAAVRSDVDGKGFRAAVAGALIAPLTLGVFIALPFLAPIALPRGPAPHPTTEELVNNWVWLKFAGAMVWGLALAMITGRSALRLTAAGLLAMVIGDSLVFGPVSGALAPGPVSAALAPLFPITLEDQPHREMTVTFPVAAATVVSLTGLAFAIAERSMRLWPLLTIGASAAAAAAGLASILLLDAIGIRTGTADLAMPKVMVVATFAVCAAVGAVQAAALSATGGRPLQA